MQQGPVAVGGKPLELKKSIFLSHKQMLPSAQWNPFLNWIDNTPGVVFHKVGS